MSFSLLKSFTACNNKIEDTRERSAPSGSNSVLVLHKNLFMNKPELIKLGWSYW